VVSEFPVTVAAKVWFWPVVSAARTGLTLTETEPVDGAVRLIVAAAVFVASATDVAVTTTAAGVGKLAGAVYVTVAPAVAERVPQAAPLQPAPVSVQVTP